MLREKPPDGIRRPAALADAAFDRLRADLLAHGPLTDSRRIVAGDVATRLGMSRTPVREALDRLGRLGYLERLDGGGYRRRRHRVRDMRDLHELRLLLEPVAAELAAVTGRRAPLSGGRSFHADVAQASGNRVLAHVVQLLAERVTAMGTDAAREWRRPARSTAERARSVAHAAVADAIARGDGAAARRAMTEHLASEAPRLRRVGSADDGGSAEGAGPADAVRRMIPASVATSAYIRLRAAIVTGRIEPGTVLSEGRIAADFDISRTPVRQALRRLELEGHVERDERGRTIVHSLSDGELSEIFTVRELLEGFGARLAAARISDDELRQLASILERDWLAHRRGDVEELARLNKEFHGLIMVASRNRALVEIVDELQWRVVGLSAFAIGTKVDSEHFVGEHARMLELLGDGDAGELEALVHAHLRAARHLLEAGSVRGIGIDTHRSEHGRRRIA